MSGRMFAVILTIWLLALEVTGDPVHRTNSDSELSQERLPQRLPRQVKPTDQGPATACDAHEYTCDNAKCINKIFLCDGDNNCHDNSDEKDCGEREPGSRCPPTHFDCGTHSFVSDFICIQKSFHCDDSLDCDNNNDEKNCSRPQITESTTKPMAIKVGDTVSCICDTTGVPKPVISWRFNDKKLPSTPQVTVQTLNGRSQVTIINATKDLSGSYSCEAHNKRGATRVYEPCRVSVRVPGEMCKPPLFNAAALSKDDCRKCFCMGLTSDCQSSKLFKAQIKTTFTNDVGFAGFRLVDEDGNEVDANFSRIEPDALTVENVTGDTNLYWKLPARYLGKKMVSYGGALQFYLRYSSPSTLGKIAVIQRIERQVDSQSKDVILEGGGLMLTYHHIVPPKPNDYTFLVTPIVEEVWQTSDGRRASRADLMRVLSNVTSILIRVGLKVIDQHKTISIKDVSLDQAVTNDEGLGRSSLVEQCRCPEGYRGLTCEYCAEGYIRDPKAKSFPVRCVKCSCNGHSDRCDPKDGTCFDCQHNTTGAHCDKCLPGFYGNATKGTTKDCLPCPCPRDQAPSRFSPTCVLAEDGKPTCDACQPEYTGRNCERCTANYTGNPLEGKPCLPKGPESCDPRGSHSNQPDQITRKCRCKAYVVGETCNACLSHFFGLGLDPYGGCLRCFCNGITDTCESSSLNKSRVVMNFTSSDSQGVVITNRKERIQLKEFSYNTTTKELVHKLNRDEPLFWSLPDIFLGNKVTSYGGLLSFFVSYDSSQHGKKLVVYFKGNNRTLKNHQRINLSRNGQRNEMMVVIREGIWQTPDDQIASRDDLMVVLASLDSILIQASHHGVSRTSLGEVSLDVALNQPTGMSRAVRVEKCACPKGYSGLSCEACSSGYYRSNRERLIGTCSKCFCNGHSEDCDPNTGICQNCLHNTFGDHCEKCKPGFFGDASVGTPLDCRQCACPKINPPNRFSKTCFLDQDGYHTCDACPVGYTGRRCERCTKPFVGNPTVVGDYCKFEEDCGCDPRGSVNNTCDPFTRQCLCKANVEGKRCNKCKAFYFSLESSNPDGCMPCFCFGVTSQCKCARGYRDKVSLAYTEDYSGVRGAVRLGDRLGLTVINTGILLVNEPPHYVYNRFDRLPRKTFYWYLPEQFLGDKISAYGGYLKFVLSHDMLLGGQVTSESDVEIRGHGLVLFHKMSSPPVSGVETPYKLRIVESSFTFEKGQIASREDFIIALSSVESILIRATYSTATYQTSLYAVSMDVVSAHGSSVEEVNSVEQCVCPSPYTGLSCQKCARGYTRLKPGPGFSRCVRCRCNRHSLECDPDTGKCLNCQHNTAGDHCELCAVGYYGDATQGTRVDCKLCSCPLAIPTNQFSSTCRVDIDGYPTCTSCQTGYIGRDCGRCAQGFTGNPRSPGGKCEKIPEELLPRATVWPRFRKDSEGTRSVFYCISSGKRPLEVTWSRLDNKALSPRAQTDSRAINIPNIEKNDEGGYVCTVKNDYGQHTARGTLSVLARPEDPITVSVSPKNLHISSGQTARFICKANSQTYYTLKWTKGESDKLPDGAVDKDGILTIESVKRMHTGTYTCTGSNQNSFDQVTVQLKVAAIITPQVSILPRFLTVNEGDNVFFRCRATGLPPPDLIWIGGPEGKLPDDVRLSKGNSVFEIFRVKKKHEGEYYCVARNDGAVGRMRTVLNVRAVGSAPIVQVSPKSLDVMEGEAAELQCTASGDPPPTFTWSRVEGDIPESSTKIDGVLRIDSLSINDSGTYVCTAANRFGAVAENAVVTVEKDSSTPPSASVNPDEITLKEGQTATITCEIDGNPLPSVSWNRLGGFLNDNHVISNNQLMIVNITEEDEGPYVCIAQNRKGVQQATSIVRVEKNIMPKIEIMPSSNQTVIGGDSVVFRCMVKEGLPLPSIEWMDGQNKTLNRSTAEVKNDMLMISRASGQDEGRYVCRANNSMGYAFAEAVLTVQAEPRVVVTPSSPYLVSVHSQVSLVCTSSGDPQPTVRWIAPDSSNTTHKPNEIEPGVWQLVIEEITMDDQGSYKCIASSVAGRAEASLDLVVTPLVKEPPQVKISPSNLTISEGQKVFFQCNVSGIPSPGASWTKKDGPLPETAVQSVPGILRIDSASASDQGVYICTATNSEGSASGSVRLNVMVPPKLSITPRHLTVEKGQSIRLYCVSSPPLPVTWTRVNGSIAKRAVMDDGVLIVDETNIEDTGKYRCQASNSAGASDAVVMVTVFVAPKVKVSPPEHVGSLGSNVTFTCLATGIPTPVITWTKQVGFLPKTHVVENGSLTMFALSGDDQGSYICTATNAAGRNFFVATLRIEELPSVSIIGGTSVKTVPVGGNLTLECHGTGIPQPSVIWGRINRDLPDEVVVKGQKLYIVNAKPSFGGTYRCSVANRVGSVQSQIVIFIQDAPQVTITPKVRKVKLRETAEFTCIVSGSPAPEVSWHRLNKSLPVRHSVKEGKLIISNVTEDDIGIYICRASNLQGISESSASIALKGVIPRFNQNPTSYMTLPTLTKEPQNFTVEIFFSPEIADGLIFYNDQHVNDSVGDFISFGMSAGYAEFRFDLGSRGPAVIRSKYRLSLYRWYVIKLTRSDNEGTLQVNEDARRTGTSKGETSQLNLNEPFYVGGVANFSIISDLAGFSKGFIGCVSYIKVDGKHLDLKNPSEQVGVTDCEPCVNNPCRNGGQCLDTLVSPGFVCQCRPGFSGRTCEVYGNGCYPEACENGRCVNLDVGGYKCVCAVGYTGERCEKGAKIETPMFEGTSYMAYPSIQGALMDVKLSMRFMVHENRNMLLLYNGQNNFPSQGDYLSISIIDGKAEFRFNLGKGPAVIRSKTNITVGKWHNVVVERDKRDGSLTLDSEPAVKDQAPCCSIGLNVAMPLYIGGVSNLSNIDSVKLGIDSGFFGCVSDVSVDDSEIDLVNTYLEMRNVRQCKDCLEPCQVGPCTNNGTCVPQGLTGYYCVCAQGFTGKNCEFHLVGPGKNRTCLNGGLPFPPSGRVCECPLGFGDERCGSVVQLGDTASFAGDGYIQYPKSVMNRILGKLETITLNIKTKSNNGLIYWQGQKIGASRGDYLVIGLDNGYLQFRYNLGAGSAIIKSRRPVNDGVWHYVKIYRQSQKGSLLVDKDEIVNGTSPQGARSLNSPGPIFIGGGPDIESLTYGVYSYNYNGCIGGVYLQSRALKLQSDAVKGFNVLPCNNGEKDT